MIESHMLAIALKSRSDVEMRMFNFLPGHFTI